MADTRGGRAIGAGGDVPLTDGEQLREAWVRGLRALFAVSRHTSRDLSLSTAFFGGLTRTIAHLAGAQRAAFWALQADGTLDIQREAHGFPEPAMERLRNVPAGAGDAGESGSPDIVRGDPLFAVARRFRDDPPQRLAWLDVECAREAVVVPWRVGDQHLGLLGVYDSARPNGFNESDVWVTRIASLAAGLVWQERQAAERLLEVERQESLRLRRYAERMAALEKIKSNVLNLAAHELRGPLAVIRGYLSLLEDGSISGPEQAARVRPILSAKADQMARLVDEMLETARLEDGRIELKLERLDLRDVVHEVTDAATLRLAAGQTLVVQREAEPVLVMGDRLRLATIVSNLVENAIKYSPAGGPIRCTVASERAAAVVRVLDRGVGIAEADLPTLFTRFGRVVTPDNSNVAGTGLGLYLCRELALLHGGDIAVESQPGVGSAFDLVLPRIVARRESAARTRPAAHDVTRFGLSDMIECGSELRRLCASAASFEQAARRIVRYLYDTLRAGGGPQPAGGAVTAEPVESVEAPDRAAALVRVFRALPYARLDGEQQELARAALGNEEPDASTLCLCLAATAGERPEWNHVRSSVRHRVVPLPRGARWSPMMARLVKDLGLDASRVRDPELFLDLIEKTCNVFHVPDARNSPYVPDQDEFVRPYRIASVLGFGGILAPMDLYVVILFSKAPISRGGAGLFRAVSHSVKLGLQPFAGHQGSPVAAETGGASEPAGRPAWRYASRTKLT
ncbi:MAG TPA: GAF domain-containing sensor histidine kinase, partial [Candidatus Eisenbacteria bacterium]|nr:GAF domain-containing sensor histidine kinase [Candidatus Eisenbacteria bacterium]